MLDTLSRWKRKLSTTREQPSTESRIHPTTQFGSTRPIRTISQPIPRSSPSSLSGSFVGGFDNLGSNSGNGGNVGNAWQDSMLSEIEDNKPMGALGRRRAGSGSSGLVQEVFGSEGAGAPGIDGSVNVPAPAVIGTDSVPPQHYPVQGTYPFISQPQQQQQQFHGLPRGTLRLQTNVQHQQQQQQQLQLINHPNRSQPDMSMTYVYHPTTIRQLSPIIEQDYITPTSTNSTSLRKAASILTSLIGSPNSASAGRNSGLRHSGSGSVSGDGGTNVGTIGSSRRQSGVTGGTGGTTSGGSGHGHVNHPGGGSPPTPATAGTIGTTGTFGSGSTMMMGGGTPTAAYVPPQHLNVQVGDISFTSTSGASQYATPTSNSQSNWSNPSAIPSPANQDPGMSPGAASSGGGSIGGGVIGGGGSRSETPEVPRKF